MLLNGKVAIVTGGAQGIGRACSHRLAREGAKVIVSDVADAQGTETAEAICADGGNARFVHANVAERLDVHNLIAAAIEAHGRIDIMVANAGVIDEAPFLELEEAEFERVLNTNVKGTFLCAQAAARQMVRQLEKSQDSPGAIVVMSSVNAWFGLPDHVAYATSKGGVMQLVKSLAIALGPHGIRVNAVGPGTIETSLMTDVISGRSDRPGVLQRTPLGRFGTTDEVAAIVAWLASDQASYVTGQTIYAEGGRMALNALMQRPESS